MDTNCMMCTSAFFSNKFFFLQNFIWKKKNLKNELILKMVCNTDFLLRLQGFGESAMAFTFNYQPWNYKDSLPQALLQGEAQ